MYHNWLTPVFTSPVVLPIMPCKEVWILDAFWQLRHRRPQGNCKQMQHPHHHHYSSSLSSCLCQSPHSPLWECRWWLIGGSAAPVATNMIIWGFVVACDSRTKVFNLVTVSAASQVNWLPLQSPLMTQRTSIDGAAALSSSSFCPLSWHDFWCFFFACLFRLHSCVTLRQGLLRLAVEAAANWSPETPVRVVAPLVWRAEDENCFKGRRTCSKCWMSVFVTLELKNDSRFNSQIRVCRRCAQ